jgi:hypothetical protein
MRHVLMGKRDWGMPGGIRAKRERSASGEP